MSAAPSAPSLRFSANLGFLWRDLPLLERIERAARAGFQGIEMHWPYEEDPDAVATLCQKHGMSVLSINTPQGDVAAGDSGLAAQRGRQEEFRDAFLMTLDWAVRSTASMIHVLPGKRNVEATRISENHFPSADNPVDSGQFDCFVKNLQWASDQARAHGKGLLLEAINGRDKPGYFYHTQEAAHAVLTACNRSNIRLMFDVYHVGVAQGDVLNRLERFIPSIGHVQIAGVPDRNEPDRGEICYRAVFEKLISLGYTGWIGCEYRADAGIESGLSRWTKSCAVTLG
ncbi:hydroxypyruvate isomerase family protein [Orrella marina]|uniref:Isomerase n=1 Tax=Orrella marina TaxID=2163011 RepID=A0A2R4XHX8_9BURK|nr:TIM barrel protein [Orrella marina]AWB33319.1 isomerase [Orrella marina]